MRICLLLNLLQLLALALLVPFGTGHLPLEVSLGRYNNLVIGIDRSIPENATLIEEIKAVLQDASFSMVLATRRSGQPGGLAFGNVTILVPDTWPQRPHYTRATWQLYSKSQIRVGPQNPRYGPVPHTEGGGGCGVPGQYTHYPSSFFLDRTHTEQLFGERSRLMIHEWGHLRWGLMDEAPQENDPQFYIHNNRFYPSRCTEQLDGKMANRHTGQPCKIDKQTLTPEPDCIFIPDETNRAVASYMGHYYVNSIKTFCDHSSHEDEAYQHNRMAPTQQNRLCRSRSVWQIIGHHADFQKERPTEIDYIPNIEVVRAHSRNVVAVLDVSESMAHPNNVPFLKLKAAMINYIRTVLEPDAKLGIVKFSTGASIVANLQTLGPANGTVRRNLELRVNQMDAIGQTDIGDGLMLGLEQLLGDSPGGGGLLFLVSDGEENMSQNPRFTFEQAVTAIKASGTTVDVLGLGPEADKRIGDLARDTGGNFYSSFNNRNSFDLLSALLSSAAQSASSSDTPVLLHSADIVPSARASGASAAPAIDDSARGQLQFVFLFPVSVDQRQANFNLTSPSGVAYGSWSSGFRRDIAVSMLSIDIEEGSFESGVWTVLLVAPPRPGTPDTADRTISMVISSKPIAGTSMQPISASASISTFKLANNSVSSSDSDGTPGVAINVALRSGDAAAAVIGARVSASVRTPDNSPLSVELRDNGLGADMRPNDGVYTGLLSPRRLTGEGDYMVSVTAESVPGVTGVVIGPPAGASPFVGGPFAKDTRANYTIRPVSNLTRNSLAGSFKLEEFLEEESKIDRVPPNPIGSLDLVSVNATGGAMTFDFTAVGDDYDQGTAARYEAYWSLNSDHMDEPDAPNSGARPVLPENVHLGSLTSPAVSGSRERLGLRFPSVTATAAVVYVTIRAVDAAGNKGGFAFPISAAFQELPFAETTGPTQPPGGGIPTVGIIIGVLVSVVVVAVVIAAAIFVNRKRSRG